LTDLGGGVSYRLVSCQHGERTGAIITFQDTAPPCEGVISWCDRCERERWELRSLDPLTVEPSVACTVHPHHHGWIRDGRWVQA